MRYVLIRDDDICYFTKPEMLETIYSKFFDENIPVNFSVIPNVACDIKLRNGGYDPLIQPEYRGMNKNFAVNENEELIKFLKSKNMEILQHGYEHSIINGIREFESKSSSEINKKITTGMTILSETFGKKPNFFAAPYDFISPQAFLCFKKYFKGLSFWKLTYSQVPVRLWLKYSAKKLSKKHYLWYGNFLIVEHPGFFVTRVSAPEKIYSDITSAVRNSDIVVLVVHYWEFFSDWNKPNYEMLSTWMKCLDYVRSQNEVEIITFSQLYEKLKK